MKYLKYILIGLFFINIQVAHADLKVKEVKHSTTSDPCNGEITVDAIGPTDQDLSAGPFTIVLTHPDGSEETFGPFDGTHTFTGLCGGMYHVCINNRFDCGACYDVRVEDCSDIQVEADILGNCSSSKKGSITLTITGGETPFSFKWFNNECTGEFFTETKDIVDLNAGTYCVTIEDNKDCIIEKTYTVKSRKVMFTQIIKYVQNSA